MWNFVDDYFACIVLYLFSYFCEYRVYLRLVRSFGHYLLNLMIAWRIFYSWTLLLILLLGQPLKEDMGNWIMLVLRYIWHLHFLFPWFTILWVISMFVSGFGFKIFSIAFDWSQVFYMLQKIMYFISLVLENLVLSSNDNEDLIYCLKVSSSYLIACSLFIIYANYYVLRPCNDKFKAYGFRCKTKPTSNEWNTIYFNPFSVFSTSRKCGLWSQCTYLCYAVKEF